MSSARVSEDAALELRTLRGAFVFFVRQPSPWIMALAISVFLATRIMAGRWRIADLIVALAVAASWHIQERLMHEYVLHMKARPLFGATLAKRLSKHHQRHHRDPWRTETLFIIRRAFLFTLPGVFGVLFAITRDIRLALSGSCAYFVTLLSYEWVHCLIHTSYEPRSDWYRRRWLNHRLHHFKNRRYWFGITSSMWDTVMRSKPDAATVETRKDWREPNPIV